MASEVITKNDLKSILDQVLPCETASMTFITALNGITGGLRLWKDPTTKTVRAYGYFRRSTDINTSTVIFNVPSEYRPTQTYELPMIISTSGNTTIAYHGNVQANGNIYQDVGSIIREGFIAGEWFYV